MPLCSAKERFPSRWGKRSTRVFNVKEQEILNPAAKKNSLIFEKSPDNYIDTEGALLMNFGNM